MDYEKIKILLAKYWLCETTLEEEQMLKDYFHQAEVHPDLMRYAPLFRYFRNCASSSSDYEALKIEELANSDSPGLNKQGGSLYQGLYKIAASVLILLSLVFIYQRYLSIRETTKKITSDTFHDPKMALEETRKMLMMVAVNYHKGMTATEKLSAFNKAEKTIKKTKKTEI